MVACSATNLMTQPTCDCRTVAEDPDSVRPSETSLMPTSESKAQVRVQQHSWLRFGLDSHRRKGTGICHVGHYPTSRLSGWDLFYPSLTQKTIAGEGYPSQVARWALQKQFLQLTIDGPVSGRLRLVGALGPQDQSVQGALGPHLVFCCELSFLILPQAQYCCRLEAASCEF